MWIAEMGFGIAIVYRTPPLPKDDAEAVFWAMSALHSTLIKQGLFSDFVAALAPARDAGLV